jgi:hypothetical protein
MDHHDDWGHWPSDEPDFDGAGDLDHGGPDQGGLHDGLDQRSLDYGGLDYGGPEHGGPEHGDLDRGDPGGDDGPGHDHAADFDEHHAPLGEPRGEPAHADYARDAVSDHDVSDDDAAWHGTGTDGGGPGDPGTHDVGDPDGGGVPDGDAGPHDGYAPEHPVGTDPDLPADHDGDPWAGQFPPALDLPARPVPVDGYPWIDPDLLGGGAPGAHGLGAHGPGGGDDPLAPSGDPAHAAPTGGAPPVDDLLSYAGLEPTGDGTDPWSLLLNGDDPAASALARWWGPTT